MIVCVVEECFAIYLEVYKNVINMFCKCNVSVLKVCILHVLVCFEMYYL